MAYIKINTNYPVYDGMPLTFKAPCDCTSTDGVTVTYADEAKSFVFKDAHGNTLAGIANLFAEGAYVKVLLDTKNGFAYIQNADTNGYLEEKFSQTVTTGGNGSAYTATVSGITELKAGVSFIMVPHTTSTSVSPTINVNGLGAISIKRRNGSFNGSVASGYNNGWLGAGVPIRLMYDGRYWVTEDGMKQFADDLQGTVPVSKGGTGYTTISDFITQNKISRSEKSSYAGTGYVNGSVSLTFSLAPKFVVIEADGNMIIWVNGSTSALAFSSNKSSEYYPLTACTVTLSNTTLTINLPGTEFNESGKTYNYVAFF